MSRNIKRFRFCQQLKLAMPRGTQDTSIQRLAIIENAIQLFPKCSMCLKTVARLPTSPATRHPNLTKRINPRHPFALPRTTSLPWSAPLPRTSWPKTSSGTRGRRRGTRPGAFAYAVPRPVKAVLRLSCWGWHLSIFLCRCDP